MAQFTRTHGDFKPVANFDTFEYTVGPANYVTVGATVQPQGPKLDYFTVTKDSGGWTANQTLALFETIQQLSTIYIYQYNSDATDSLAVAVYDIGAWGDVTATGPGTLHDALVAAGSGAVTITTGATFAG